MRRKIFFLAAVLLSAVFPAVASAETQYELTPVFSDGYIDISGNATPGETISIMVLPEGITPESVWDSITSKVDKNATGIMGNGETVTIPSVSAYADGVVMYVDDAIADAEGKFSIKVGLANTGKYDFFLTSGDNESKSFTSTQFTTDSDYAALIAKLNDKIRNSKEEEFHALFTADNINMLGLSQNFTNRVAVRKVTEVLYDSLIGSALPVNSGENKVLWNNSISQAIMNQNQSQSGSGGGGGGGGGGGNAKPQTDKKPTVLITEDNTATPIPQPMNKDIFDDISGVEWAKKAIVGLASKSIISGKEQGKFCPDDYITREEFTKLVVAAFAQDATADNIAFSDVPRGRWSYDYIAKAKNLGFINGYSDSYFGATDRISRQDMAVIIYNVAKYKNVELKSGDDSMKFGDDAEIASYAKTAVYTLKESGIINGFDSVTFAPTQYATRAQAAVMIHTLLLK